MNGIQIVGTRGIIQYAAKPAAAKAYAQAINKYKEALPDINIYCMIMPTSAEYYSPPSIEAKFTRQLGDINVIYENLENITPIDVHTVLGEHKNEDIYLRTDHHWSALGGYYAAREFAKAAGVPFLALSDYTVKVNTGYTGTMYGYTGNNPIIKNNPEDFVYYVPNSAEWSTTYRNYILDKNDIWNIVGMDKPFKFAFFLDHGNNNTGNYCTFMGGDAKIVTINTGVKNGRKLALFKDSFGNTMPAFWFGSFEEIHVLDLRYFTYNGVEYMRDNGITDLLFANNTTMATNMSMVRNYEKILTQETRVFE